MLEELKKEVCAANKLLFDYGLVILTFGNVSGFDRESNLMVIKPSGINYRSMTPDDMVVVDINGKTVEGNLLPSGDTPMHLELYKNFKAVSGIAHTHSKWATVWAQSGRDMPAYGVTHADHFNGTITCTGDITSWQIENSYEKSTGISIIEKVGGRNPLKVPAMFIKHHGPVVWGETSMSAVENAIVLENAAMTAWHTEKLFSEKEMKDIAESLMEKHFNRKNGPGKTYGQRVIKD